MDREHECPGGCGAAVPHKQLACKPCWFRLPAPLRNAVNNAYRQRARYPVPHREAVKAAVRWYRANPPEGR